MNQPSSNNDLKIPHQPGSNWLGPALAAARRGILFLVSYVLFEFLLILVVINGGGAVDRIFDIRALSDSSLILLMMLYAVIIALPFAGYGFIAAKRFPASMRIHTFSLLSVVMVGFAIWYATFASVKGATSDFGGITWLPYQVFVLWALPLFESAKSYITDSSSMKVTALLASVWPSLFALLGIGARKAAASNRGTRILKTVAITLASLWLFIFALTSLWPRHSMFTAETFPKIDGATAAIPFGKILMRELTGTNKPWAEQHVYFNTTHAAYENLIAKKADLIFVAGPSDEELKLAEASGVKLKLTPIGKDAFIFLVHTDNEISNLSVQQIQDIYAGKTNSWSNVGGPNERIIAFQREKNSGSQTYMEQKVMKGLQLAEPPKEKKSSGMGGLIDAVADYKNGSYSIGYSFYYFANEMHKREQVKFLSVDGIESNKENIRKGTYPYTALLYAVTREDEPVDSSASRLLQWLLSVEGKGMDAIERGGFVPVLN
ncbi:PstS family phosphate ABC transporter substrate-binding protein [Paenibacillus foliorum]|uniref:PstS family phosphate ABC transporter substrate-binding protein n=1 Tax=Paenibacillus foliorum TaxID=2654974 RepID=UPI0014921137|nr:substrate-binding domain-containing protein [Paenibacillus foliorum]